MATYTKAYHRPPANDVNEYFRRLMAAVAVRAYKDLNSEVAYFRATARTFFDEEGISLVTALGVPERKVRRKLAEVI